MSAERLQKLLEFHRADPGDPFLNYAIATEYAAANNTDEALKWYLDLLTVHPAYVGTYYHLGKLYERLGNAEEAIAVYRRGIVAARNAGDRHALSELQGALNMAAGLDDDDDE
jgi:tetratricopeptide (TPR) repeat protein